MKVVSTTILSANNATANSSALDTNQAVNLTFQGIFSDAAAAGSMKVQGSNDQPPQGRPSAAFTPTHWSDIPNATATVTSGAAPMIVLSNVACQYMRVVYTRSAGAGTIIIKANAVGA